MPTNKHTPGPWTFRLNEKSKYEIRPGFRVTGSSIGYSPIAVVNGDKRLVNDDVRLTNARLIAAAPELLKALQLIVIMIDAPADEPDIKRCLDAIAKATGD